MSSPNPSPPHDLRQFKRLCKELLKACRRGESEALERVHQWHPDPPEPGSVSLHHVQLALARQHGFRSWRRLKFSSGGKRLLDHAQHGRVAALKKLITEDPSVLDYADEERTAVHIAVMAGQAACVQALLEAGANIDRGFYPDREFSKPLDLAREREDQAIVNLLEQHLKQPPPSAPVVEELPHHKLFGLSLDPEDELAKLTRLVEEGLKPDLRAAAWLGNQKAVAQLSHNRRDFEDALIFASQSGQVDLIAWLLQKGAHIDAAREEFMGWEEETYRQVGLPIWHAAARGNLNVVEFLLENGASNNEMIYAGGTPIMVACQMGHTDVVKRLANSGAPEPIDWENDGVEAIQEKLRGQMWLLHEDFALPIACRSGRTEVVEYLLSLSPDFDDEQWADCCHYTMMALKEEPTNWQNAPRILELLWEHTDPLYTDHRDETLLHRLCSKWCHRHPARLRLADMLLDAGVDIDATDSEKKATALGWASQAGQLDLVAHLIDRGADTQRAGAVWSTPSRLAAGRGHDKVVEYLKHSS
jgi:ankyrin repeat protein